MLVCLIGPRVAATQENNITELRFTANQAHENKTKTRVKVPRKSDSEDVLVCLQLNPYSVSGHAV